MGSTNSKINGNLQTKIESNNSKEAKLPDIYDETLEISKTSTTSPKGNFDEGFNSSRLSSKHLSRVNSYTEITPVSVNIHVKPHSREKLLDPNELFLDWNNNNPRTNCGQKKSGENISSHIDDFWSKELQEGIQSLAISRAPTTIDPPETPIFRDAIANNEDLEYSYIEHNTDTGSRGVTHSPPLEKQQYIPTTTDSELESLNPTPYTSPRNEVHKNPHTSEFEVDSDNSNCSRGRLFWVKKKPKARCSGTRIPSFIAPPPDMLPRTKTGRIHRRSPTIRQTRNKLDIRNSTSAQEWKSPKWSTVKKTSISCEKFNESKGKLKEGTDLMYEYHPAEPVSYIQGDNLDEYSDGEESVSNQTLLSESSNNASLKCEPGYRISSSKTIIFDDIIIGGRSNDTQSQYSEGEEGIDEMTPPEDMIKAATESLSSLSLSPSTTDELIEGSGGREDNMEKGDGDKMKNEKPNGYFCNMFNRLFTIGKSQ